MLAGSMINSRFCQHQHVPLHRNSMSRCASIWAQSSPVTGLTDDPFYRWMLHGWLKCIRLLLQICGMCQGIRAQPLVAFGASRKDATLGRVATAAGTFVCMQRLTVKL